MKQLGDREKVKPQFTIQLEAIGSTEHFSSPCEIGFRQRGFHYLIGKILIVTPLSSQNALVFRNGSSEVVENVRFVRIEFNRKKI